MSDFYRDMQNIASELLSEFDQSRGTGAQSDGLWYIAQVKSGPPDAPILTPTPYKFDGVARTVSRKYVDGTNIVQTDEQAVFNIRDDGVKPAMGGTVLVDGARRTVVGLRQIPPSGVPVATVVIFRK